MRSIFEDQKLTLADGVSRLEAADLNYMLTGSVSMVRFAMMRMTNDIDIVVELTPRDRHKIVSAFSDDYYVPEEKILGAIERTSMFNVISQSTLVKIDIVVRKNDAFQRHVFANRERTSIWDVPLWAIRRDDLILSKLNWARDTHSELQMRDIAGIMLHGYDEKYVEEWVLRLDVKDFYEACVKLAGGGNA